MSENNAPTLDIDYVAKLARIELTQAQKDKLSGQLSQILGYFDKLAQVDITDVKASAHAHEMYNVWRKDECSATLSVDEVLMNAPANRDSQIIVPKVVDDA
ncbi:MAG: Asp-tRNA(Asn)/Glu-tRNA(Gln) amidotransferase subunit GatC [Opitutales bacterium]